jgi:hypothetical protein
MSIDLTAYAKDVEEQIRQSATILRHSKPPK